MKIVYKKVKPSVCKQNREFYKNHVRQAFIMWCAYEGLFDECFTKQEIEQAKRGVLPNDCNVHHRVPLSGCDDESVHSFNNLTVLHVKTHERINREIFAPQLRTILNAPYGTVTTLEVPEFDYVDVEGIKKEREIKRLMFLKRKYYGQ